MVGLEREHRATEHRRNRQAALQLPFLFDDEGVVPINVVLPPIGLVIPPIEQVLPPQPDYNPRNGVVPVIEDLPHQEEELLLYEASIDYF